jgi:hypothetical protein
MTERLNVRRMQVPERSESRIIPFDPEKEVTEEDWGIIEGFRSGYLERGEWREFLNVASSIKILDPDKCPPLSDKTLQAIYESELAPYEQDLRKEYFENLYRLKLIDPSQTGPNLSQTEKEVLHSYVEADRESTHSDRQSWDYFVHIAAKACVLDPGYIPDIPRDDRIGITKRLEELRRLDSLDGWIGLASSLRIILPNFTTDVVISPGEWDEIKEWYHDNKTTPSRKRMLYKAAQLKILAAEELKITDHGLEITMRKDVGIERESKPQPEALQL